MTERGIVLLAFFFIYFHISGLATTNIVRLTAGNTAPVLASRCVCDACGGEIPPLLQLPIVSFLICKGRCRSCGVKIPVFPLLLELTVLAGMFGITLLLGCGAAAVSGSFLFYELVRVAVILRLGKRTEGFVRQYVIAVLSMLPFYLMTLFVALLYGVV